MAELRDLFLGLGFGHVRTVLNSGNVVFTAPGAGCDDVRTRIADELGAQLGLTARVIVLTGDEVVRAVLENPWSAAAPNPSDVLVVVPQHGSDLERLRPLLNDGWTPEVLGLGSRVAYLWCANGVARSPLWAAVERALRRSGTARNLATMTKLGYIVERAP